MSIQLLLKEGQSNYIYNILSGWSFALMLSKNTIKLVKSLQLKKNRIETGLFLVEGLKSVLELLSSDFQIVKIIVTEKSIQLFRNIKKVNGLEIELASVDELSSMGSLSTNDACIAIVNMKKNLEVEASKEEIVVALDNVQDPGNLGTIIRTADWFGVHKIWCSSNCVDFYNSKAIAATMGSFTRVKIEYCDLENKLRSYSENKFTVYGADMNGVNIATLNAQYGILVMGNEANGISPAIKPYINQTIAIKGKGNAESLNVAMATGIILYELTK